MILHVCRNNQILQKIHLKIFIIFADHLVNRSICNVVKLLCINYMYIVHNLQLYSPKWAMEQPSLNICPGLVTLMYNGLKSTKTPIITTNRTILTFGDLHTIHLYYAYSLVLKSQPHLYIICILYSPKWAMEQPSPNIFPGQVTLFM